MGSANVSADLSGASGIDEGRYRLLVENIVDHAIFMLDPAGTVISWNSGAQQIKGYRAEEVIGQHFSIFYTDADRQRRLPAEALALAQENGRVELEGWRIRKDGSQFWASVVIGPVYEHGGLVGFAKITRDLTERKQAEEALRSSQEQFRVLVQGVTDYAIYMLDPSGTVSSWNSGAQRIKGYDPSEIIGQHFSAFYTEEDRARGEPSRALETALRQGQYSREGWRVRKDGSRFWASVLIDPIRSPDGDLIGFAKVTRDVSDRRAREIELAKTQEALRQSQKMEAIGQLTGGVAHDFNNLLTVVMSSVDMLRRPNITEERREKYINAISETVERASRLTSQLLSFARRQALKPEGFDVAKQVSKVIELIQPLVGPAITVDCIKSPETCIALADVSQFETALINLAVNARDAMNGAGEISISVRLADAIPALRNHPGRAGSFVRISMTDTGTGIASDQIEKIFEPFFTTKPVGQGTGLGLSQVFGFARQSGGDILAESVPGQGSTFSIFLPRTNAASSQVRRGRSGDEDQAVTGARILVVEDDSRVGEVTMDLLRDLGHLPLLVTSARQALDQLSDPGQSFDLIFSDVIMPGINGIELARRVKQSLPDVPVVLASGYSDIFTLDDAAGFDLIRKPYTVQSLSRAIDLALKTSARRTE